MKKLKEVLWAVVLGAAGITMFAFAGMLLGVVYTGAAFTARFLGAL